VFDEVNEMMIQIENDKSVAEDTRKTVSAQEKDANEKASEAKEIADSAQKDLDKALPALDDAVRCLKELKPADITEIRSMTSPPAGVKLVCETVCIMKEIRPVRKPNPNKPGERIND
jgi:dynein heavy chain